RKHTGRRFSHWLLDMNRWRIILFAVFMVACVAPTLLTAVVGFQQYSTLKNLAYDGLGHFQAIQKLADAAPPVPDASSTPTPTPTKSTGKKKPTKPTTPPTPPPTFQEKARAVLTPSILAQVGSHCTAAKQDFLQINQIIAQGDGALGLALYTP